MATPPTEPGERRIVAGVDGSAPAREALRWACRLADLHDAEIVVVHALGLLEPLRGELVPAHRRRAEIEQIMTDEWCTTPRAHGRAFRVVVDEGHPVDVLTYVAQTEGAELIVVGSRGIGATPARALGSTSLHLLQVAPCPVLVVPGPPHAGAHLALRRILVAVGSTDPTSAAVDLAAGLAQELEAALTVVHAIEEVPTFPLAAATEAPRSEVEARRSGRARLQPLCERLRQRGLAVDLRVELGPALEVVASATAAVDADLVVLGSASPGRAGDPLGGSVSRQLVASLRGPALVVPDPQAPYPHQRAADPAQVNAPARGPATRAAARRRRP